MDERPVRDHFAPLADERAAALLTLTRPTQLWRRLYSYHSILGYHQQPLKVRAASSAENGQCLEQHTMESR